MGTETEYSCSLSERKDRKWMKTMPGKEQK